MLNIQSRRVSEKSRVIVSPMLVAVAEMKKAGIFDANRIASVSAINVLEQPVSVLKGIGPGGAQALASLQIVSLLDLVKNHPTTLVGLEPNVARVANAARNVMVRALERNGISVEVRPNPGMGHTTLAVFVDPVTGISYSR